MHRKFPKNGGSGLADAIAKLFGARRTNGRSAVETPRRKGAGMITPRISQIPYTRRDDVKSED